jgi:hypothetical protein
MKVGDQVEVWNVNSSGDQLNPRYIGRISRVVDENYFREGPSYCVSGRNGLVEWVPEVSLRPL